MILRNYSGVNICSWKPVDPDTYRVCVAIWDAQGKVVTKATSVVEKRASPPRQMRLACARIGETPKPPNR